MKKTIFATFILLVLSGSIVSLAQQPPYLHKRETKKLLGEQPERSHHIYNPPPVSMNTPAHQPLAKNEMKELNTIIPDFQVNDDPGSAGQYYPSISTDGSGNFVITWTDERNGDYDIYAQRYSSDGSALGTNFKVNDDPGSADQYYPSISTDGSGNFVITWTDERNGDDDIYTQRYAIDGSALGTNFKVNDDPGSAHQRYPSISTDSSGNFVITWMDNRNGDYDYDIYAQRYAIDGSTFGTNFKVNDDQTSAWQESPSISINSGNFVISWEDERSGDRDIYAQRYASDGSVLGTNFKVNDDQINVWQESPSISIDGSGNFVITWIDNRNGNYDIYTQRYASDGSALEPNFKVNDDPGSAYQYYPSISTNSSGNFVISWEDERNGDFDIYAQRYASDGSAFGNNFRVTNTGTRNQLFPEVKLWNGRIYNTWRDNRVDNIDYDIWANVLDWVNPVGIIDEELSQIPSAFILSQNYPNPFNPTTTIRYNLQSAEFVILKVYDVLGREIAMLVNEQQTAGSYSVRFDSRKVGIASGLYFYKISAGNFNKTRKMIIMK